MVTTDNVTFLVKIKQTLNTDGKVED